MNSNADIISIAAIKHRSAVTLHSAAEKLRILKDCTAVSSGTLSTLTGIRRYELLDAVHGDFVVFVEALIPRRNWRTWIDAWKEFYGVYGPVADV